MREQIPRDKKGGCGQHNMSWTSSEAADEQQGLMMKHNSTGFVRGKRLLTDETKVLIIMTGRGEMPLNRTKEDKRKSECGELERHTELSLRLV